MVDPKRAAKLIREHFAQLTTEQFIENLKRSCPEVFEEEQDEQITPDSKTEQLKKDSENLHHEYGT